MGERSSIKYFTPSFWDREHQKHQFLWKASIKSGILLLNSEELCSVDWTDVRVVNTNLNHSASLFSDFVVNSLVSKSTTCHIVHFLYCFTLSRVLLCSLNHVFTNTAYGTLVSSICVVLFFWDQSTSWSFSVSISAKRCSCLLITLLGSHVLPLCSAVALLSLHHLLCV